MDLKMDSGDWIGEETFLTPIKAFQFEEEDEFLFGYEQPLIVNSFEVVVNPTVQAIDTDSCIISEIPIQIEIANLSSPIDFGAEFTLDASDTELSKFDFH